MPRRDRLGDDRQLALRVVALAGQPIVAQRDFANGRSPARALEFPDGAFVVALRSQLRAHRRLLNLLLRFQGPVAIAGVQRIGQHLDSGRVGVRPADGPDGVDAAADGRPFGRCRWERQGGPHRLHQPGRELRIGGRKRGGRLCGRGDRERGAARDDRGDQTRHAAILPKPCLQPPPLQSQPIMTTTSATMPITPGDRPAGNIRGHQIGGGRAARHDRHQPGDGVRGRPEGVAGRRERHRRGGDGGSGAGRD